MTRFPILAALFAILLLAACASTAPTGSVARPEEAPPASSRKAAPETTIILDRAAADRLRAAKGITLQWIGWDRRGSLRVIEEDGVIRLIGAHHQADGPGRLALDGEVREIGADYFIFDGLISIADTPDSGRSCSANKQWRFAITQDRPYWRLREFEWCDGLTDYVDIYF